MVGKQIKPQKSSKEEETRKGGNADTIAANFSIVKRIHTSISVVSVRFVYIARLCGSFLPLATSSKCADWWMISVSASPESSHNEVYHQSWWWRRRLTRLVYATIHQQASITAELGRRRRRILFYPSFCVTLIIQPDGFTGCTPTRFFSLCTAGEKCLNHFWKNIPHRHTYLNNIIFSFLFLFLILDRVQQKNLTCVKESK